ncbi:MAG TPA: 30S ribosome-binding factor RbfA [Candidatus Tectomicrobia bacterium]|jgi:ribosome-binding factor A|nr:30S ribosome-binding factor RbfA [Candidatus Tectomicrobia bacterium]
MHPYKRSERLGELILAEISDLTARDIKDPRVGFVTFTRVEMSDDLRYAKVFVSSLGSEQEKARTLQGLASATGYIRRHLGRALHLRYTPDITFLIDESLEHGAKIAQLLRQLHAR